MRKEEFIDPFGTLKEINSKEWGKYLTFMPNKLPPIINFDQKLALALSKAEAKLSKLSGAGLLLPNPGLLVMPYLRKEALSSSRIEGTRISLSDYFLAEAKGEEDKEPNASEVINYVRAINFALTEIENKNIDIKLIKEMHKILMNQVRGKDKFPGKFRTIQNWIGLPNSKPQEASFVPPEAKEIKKLLEDMVDYLNTYDEMPLLIKTALLHYQFETIHPFCDGNGRIGRALIVLYLIKKNKLSQPLLYISGFFEKYRQEYARILENTNKKGNFRDWIFFFLEAIKEQSEEALNKSIQLQKLKEKYRTNIQKENQTNLSLQVIDMLFINPYIQISKVVKKCNTSYPTAKRTINKLISQGILKKINNAERNKTYVAFEILEIIQ